jgi:hypothetical protein
MFVPVLTTAGLATFRTTVDNMAKTKDTSCSSKPKEDVMMKHHDDDGDEGVRAARYYY